MGIFLYIALAIGAVVGAGGGVVVQKFFLQPAAIEKAVRAEAERCAGKINEIRALSAEAALDQLDQAYRAASGVGPVPVDRAELQAMCDRDINCKERAQ